MSNLILSEAMVLATEYLSRHDFLFSKEYTLDFSVSSGSLSIGLTILHRGHWISYSVYVSASQLYASSSPRSIVIYACDRMIDNLWQEMEY